MSITRLLGLLIISVGFYIPTLREHPKQSAPEVELSLSVPRTTFRIGESIPVRVEITNRGKDDFLVGRHLNDGAYTNPSHTSIILSDASTGGGPEVQDLSELLTPKAVATWWLAIAPNHFYGVEIILHKSTNQLLNKPGRYLLRVEYASKGGTTAAVPGADVPSSTVWRGTLNSNVVAINVLPASEPVDHP